MHGILSKAITSIQQQQLNARNKMNAINSWALQVTEYIFGVAKWLCKHTMEPIQHICSGYPALAQKDCLERHNSSSVVKVVHQVRVNQYGLKLP
jgi:hypothetical protein